MSCENSGDIDVPLPAERNGNASLPFVKVGYDGSGELTGDVLKKNDLVGRHMGMEKYTRVTEEPCYEIAKHDGLISLLVVWGARDSGEIP